MGRVAELVRRWAYAAVPEAAGKRDLRLDLLRGFCVFVMVADHIGGEPSWLYAITGGGRFFVSAAEGFVLVSGITIGIVYGDLFARRGPREMLAKLLARARLLYTVTVTFTLVFAGLSLVLGDPWTRDVTPDRPHRFVLGIFTLHRSYSLTDVLLLYTFLVLFAGPLLLLIGRSRWPVVLAASWTLWLGWQLWPQQVQVPWEITDGGFPFAAWQVIFTNGLVVGYHRARVVRLLSRWSLPLLIASAALTVALVAVFLNGALATYAGIPDGGIGQPVDRLFGKHDLRGGRLVALAIVGAFAYGLLSVAWVPVRRAVGWLLLPLGQQALSAYSVHLFVVALAASQLADPLRGLGQHAYIQVLGVLLVWVALPIIAQTVPRLRSLAASGRGSSLVRVWRTVRPFGGGIEGPAAS